MRAIVFFAAVLIVAASGPAFGQYRWVDGNGKVHYGDAPPRDAKDIKALGTRGSPSPGAESTANLPFELRRAMERAPVVLYTSPDCQPCTLGMSLLRERGVPYAERTIASADDLQEFRRLSGSLRLPHLTVGGQAQNGFNPELWTSLLDAAGYPKGSMLPRSYQWQAPQPLVPPPPKADGKAVEEQPAPSGQPPKRP